MGDVADGADVDGGLARNDLWVEGRDLLGVEAFQGLLVQVFLGVAGCLLFGDDLLCGDFDHLELGGSVDVSVCHSCCGVA